MSEVAEAFDAVAVGCLAGPFVVEPVLIIRAGVLTFIVLWGGCQSGGWCHLTKIQLPGLDAGKYSIVPASVRATGLVEGVFEEALAVFR